MKEIPAAPPLPNAPPAQDFSKLGFIYITVLGLADQVVPHTGSWHPLATLVNYLIKITPIVYMAFQAQPASPVGVQSDSGMGCDTTSPYLRGRLSSSHLVDNNPLQSSAPSSSNCGKFNSLVVNTIVK
ncbi:hypothetical protein DSO57_1003473 [Entomophthora muscae]|uniref:Uncharacterized protein n=1 Tax=Entomophthora muscae TaxID=34485 RepID=A0ACC2UTY0_9FUNG|nr:hypothetical protein DSO57_1003473 [Entomophthora muscae]